MKRIYFILSIPMFLLSACTALKITHSWTSPTAQQKDYNKILVVCISHQADQAMREKMENHLVSDLKQLGYNVLSSLKEYGPKTFRKMDEDAVINQLQDSGFEAVLTIVLLDKTKERYYLPSQIYYSPYGIYQSYFWGYYTTIYDRVYSPGYYSTATMYFWESNLYDVATKELLCSIQTESFNPASTESMAHEYGKLIVNNMVKSHVLGKREIAATK